MKSTAVSRIWPALVADGLGLLLLFWLREPLRTLLAQPSGQNSLLLIGVYLLFLGSIFWLRRLEEVGETGFTLALGQRSRTVLAVLFALVMMTAISYQFGYFDSFMRVGPAELDEGASSSLFVYAPSAWLFLSLCYVFALAFPIAPRVAAGSRAHDVTALLVLLGCNALFLLALAQLRALADLFAVTGALRLVLTWLLLALLFAPPRLIYAQKRGGWPALASFLALFVAT